MASVIYCFLLLSLSGVSSFGFSTNLISNKQCLGFPLRSFTSRPPGFVQTKMSDLSDMTIEMMKRLEQNLGQLPEVDLVRVRGMCTNVGKKCDMFLAKMQKVQSTPEKVASQPPPPAQNNVQAKSIFDSRKKAEEEADKFFGISSPLSESGDPVDEAAKTNFLKQQILSQERKTPNISAGSVSKYLDIRPESTQKQLPTDEAIVDENEWNKAYIQEFGSPPPKQPLVDEDVPRPLPKEGEKDAFAFLRQVQANAHTYATPEDYYKALNDAIANWKGEKRRSGQVMGAANSDRYMEKLFDMKPFSDNANPISLQVTFNEGKGVDGEGKDIDILICTQVDKNGPLGVAGVQVGDVLLELDGERVGNFAALRATLKRLSGEGRRAIPAVLHRKDSGETVELRINA